MSIDVKSVSDKVLSMLAESTNALGYDPDLIKAIPSGLEVFDLYTGGLPVGAPIVLVGNPGSGKSTLAATLLANLEKKYDTFSVYVDNEYSMSKDRFEILGAKRVLLKAGLTLEQIVELFNQMVELKHKMKIDKPSLFVWDTYANTMSEKEMAIDDPAKATGWRVRLLGHHLPKMIAKAIEANIVLIIINQLRDLISMDSYVTPAKELKHFRYGKDMPGGNPLKFNAFTLLDLKDTGLLPDSYGFYGSKVAVTTVKCKFRPSGTSFELILDHSHGFDDLLTKFEFLVKRKAIVAAGGFRRLKNDPTQSFRLSNLRNKYENDSKFRAAFNELFEQEKQAVLNQLGKMVIAHADIDNTNPKEEAVEENSESKDTKSELEDLMAS